MKKLWDRYKELPAPFKATIWFFMCLLLQNGLSIITTPIFTRIMSTDEYGNFSVFYSWMGIVSIFASLNLYCGVYEQGLVKFEKDDLLFSSSLQGLTLVSLIFCFFLYVIFHNIINSYLHFTTAQMILMFVMILANSSFNFWVVEQRVKLNYKALVGVTLVSSFLQTVLGIILVYTLNDKVTARIISVVAVQIFCYSYFVVKQIVRGKHLFNKFYWRYALSFNLPLIPHYLSQILLSSSDRIMIENLVGASEAGIYSLAYSISSIMTIFNSAILQTLNPMLYRKIHDNKVNEIPALGYSSLIFIAIVNIMLISIAPELLMIFAPAEYREAIWVIPIISISMYFIFSYSLFACFEFYFKQTKFIMLASIISAVLNVALNYIFIKIYGYIAAGYTTLICYIIYALGHYLFMRKVCRDNLGMSDVYNARILLAISILFICIGFVLMMTYKIPFIRYGAILAVIVVLVVKRKLVTNYINATYKAYLWQNNNNFTAER